ncbi:MAG: helix-turn-helix transcriptional regulator [Calothrix sp. MO_167.B12]|nr:helix-turn-helix transcriptional regulator [Calothrix sp. MO_167.B12]
MHQKQEEEMNKKSITDIDYTARDYKVQKTKNTIRRQLAYILLLLIIFTFFAVIYVQSQQLKEQSQQLEKYNAKYQAEIKRNRKRISDKNYKSFLSRLRQARREAKLTLEDVANKLNQPQSYVSQCESGERVVDVIDLYSFARIYNKPLNYFIEVKKSPLSDNQKKER